MVKAKIDAAEGRWLPNKIWFSIIIAAVMLSSSFMGVYYNLRAADVENATKLELFQKEVNGKLDKILDKVDSKDCGKDKKG